MPSSGTGEPAENLCALAKSVAGQLRQRGISPEEVITTTEREEERSTGFLGMKKKKVMVADTKRVPLGWQLWSQMMNDALYLSSLSGPSRPVNHVSKELQLWLREDGEIVAVVYDRDHVIIPNRHVENMAIRPATDDELHYADHEWHEVDEAGYPNPSVEFKKFWTCDIRGEPLDGSPYGGLESRLLAVQDSTT